MLEQVKLVSLQISTRIDCHFGCTKVSGKWVNSSSEAANKLITIVLPSDSAFITTFEVNDTETELKCKSVGERHFEEQILSKNSAAFLRIVPNQEQNTIDMFVHVARFDELKFSFTYQEVMMESEQTQMCQETGQVFNFYSLKIDINPQQVVEDFSINIFITEATKLCKIVEITGSENAEIFHRPKTVKPPSLRINCEPSIEEQTNNGSHTQFAVKYKILLENHVLHSVNGYFFQTLHSGVNSRKDVLLLLDTSTMMKGSKLEQAKASLKTIIEEISESDNFSVFCFSEMVTCHIPWTNGKVSTKNKALESLDAIVTKGRCNIGEALRMALVTIFLRCTDPDHDPCDPIIIMLSQGHATQGFLNDDYIGRPFLGSTDSETNKHWTNKKLYIPFNFLSFGREPRSEFFRRITSAYYGVTRTIYENCDAAQQTKGFYELITCETLQDDVAVEYWNERKSPAKIAKKYLENQRDRQVLAALKKPRKFSTTSIDLEDIDENEELQICQAGRETEMEEVTRKSTSTSLDSSDIDVVKIMEAKQIEADDKLEQIITLPLNLDELMERKWASLTINKLLSQGDERSKAKAIDLCLLYKLISDPVCLVSRNDVRVMSGPKLSGKRRRSGIEKLRPSVGGLVIQRKPAMEALWYRSASMPANSSEFY